MKSIDNMREYVLTAASVNATTRAVLAGYIDGIEREVDDMWHALTIDAKPMTDENMAESGWARLPVDAEGAPIHVGDVMEWLDEPGITRTVTSIQLANDGWWVYISGTGRRPDKYRHHHAPTVEDVLRELVERLDEIGSEDDCVGEAEQECRACIRRDIAAAYAECAAKLTLRGDE